MLLSLENKLHLVVVVGTGEGLSGRNGLTKQFEKLFQRVKVSLFSVAMSTLERNDEDKEGPTYQVQTLPGIVG